MSTGQIHRFVYAKADDAANLSLFKALDPTSVVTVETLKLWDPKYCREPFLVEIDDQPVAPGSDGEWFWWYKPGRYRDALAIHPACSHLDLYSALIENRSFCCGRNSGSQFNRRIALHRQVQNGVVQSGRALCRT